MVAATVPALPRRRPVLIYGHWPPTASVNARGDIVRTGCGSPQRLPADSRAAASPNAAAFTLSVTGHSRCAAHASASVTVGAHESRTVPITIIGPAAAVAGWAGRRSVCALSSGRDLKDRRRPFSTRPRPDAELKKEGHPCPAPGASQICRDAQRRPEDQEPAVQPDAVRVPDSLQPGPVRRPDRLHDEHGPAPPDHRNPEPGAPAEGRLETALLWPSPLQTLCDLCGLPARAPLAAQIGDRAHTFCCAGCRQVYQILSRKRPDRGGPGPDPDDALPAVLADGLIARPEKPPRPQSWGSRR